MIEKFQEIVGDKDKAIECALFCIDQKMETLLSSIGKQKYMWDENDYYLVNKLKDLKKEVKNG